MRTSRTLPLRALAALAALGASPASAQEPLSASEPHFVAGEESASLESLRRAEEALFHADRGEASVTVDIPAAASSAVATRSAPAQPPAAPHGLNVPDLPVQWDEAVLRYLDYFTREPSGRRMMQAWVRRAERFGPLIERTLQEAGLPSDLRCVAMAESGFDPTVRSNRGAVGMWQFVSRTGEEYGLSQDRWIDERMDHVASTQAAARFLGDLHRRLGSWELALAAYNMGYTALLRSIRKYNTNDFWLLAGLEAGLPFETKRYVAKIAACAVVLRNTEHFGFDREGDPWEIETLEVPGGVQLARLARLAHVPSDRLRELNPHLRRNRTPPGRTARVHVPAEHLDEANAAWARLGAQASPASETYVVRLGEDLRTVARRFHTSQGALRELNGIESDESVGAGTALLVPAGRRPEPADEDEAPLVAVPSQVAPPPGTRRVFYRARGGEALAAIAEGFGVSPVQLGHWNHLDPDAHIMSGMYVQAFVPTARELTGIVALEESQVRIATVGSDDFYQDYEREQGRVRFRYTCAAGDTLASLGSRFGLSVGSIARINDFSRRTELQVGQVVVLYAEEHLVPEHLRPAPSEGSPDEAGPRGAASRTSDDGEDELEDVDDLPFVDHEPTDEELSQIGADSP